jgi:hypothetical protein
VEGMTDEFTTLVKTQDVMAKLDGVVEGEMDDGFRVQEENVNKSKGAAAEPAKVAKVETSKQSKTTSKRPASKTPTKAPAKARKSTSKKGTATR